VQVSATINNTDPRLKTFLCDFFTKTTLLSEITHKEVGITTVVAQGHPAQFPQVFNVLKDLLHLWDENSEIFWGETVAMSERDHLNGVTFEILFLQSKETTRRGSFMNINLRRLLSRVLPQQRISKRCFRQN
jgi:hypothetical protein